MNRTMMRLIVTRGKECGLEWIMDTVHWNKVLLRDLRGFSLSCFSICAVCLGGWIHVHIL